MNEKIQEIKNLMNQRKMLDVKALLDELGENVDTLQEFFDEVKKVCRESGKTNMVMIQTLENLLVKYGGNK